MALGTTLGADIETALANSDNATTSSNLIATAINDYLQPAVYADGALTYTFTLLGPSFLLPTVGTAAAAATQWANAVQAYWVTGVVVGVAGRAQNGGSAVSPPHAITASLVSATLQPLLLAVFSVVGGTLAGKATDIAAAIETAVATIVTAHSEVNAAAPPPLIGPFAGTIS